MDLAPQQEFSKIASAEKNHMKNKTMILKGTSRIDPIFQSFLLLRFEKH
jgi:hypothetical protein